MSIVENKNYKIIVAIIVLIAMLIMSVNSFAATIYTSKLNKGDQLKFTGNAWTVYSTKAAAQDLNTNKTKRYIKTGEKLTIKAKDGNVLKIADNEYIYYGSTASKYFTKTSSVTTVYTKGLKKDDVLKFTGNAWTVYSTKTAAQDLNTNKTKRYIKNGEKIKILEIDGNALKIADGEYIYYGSTAAKYFTKTASAVKVNKITLNETSKDLEKGKTFAIKVTVKPDNAANKNVTFTSNNEKIAKVDSKGNVTAVAKGTAVITVKAKDGSNVKAECKINVIEPKTVEISFNAERYTIEKDEKLNLKNKLTIKNTDNKEVTFTSSNEKVGTVDNKTGEFKVKGLGTTVIGAVSKADKTKIATCKVTVVSEDVKITDVKLDKKEAKMITADTLQLTATVTAKPDKSANKKIEWKSSNEEVANVNGSGLVTAKKAGTALITAKSIADPSKKAECKITVTGLTIKLNENNKELKKGKTFTIKATVTPSKAANKEVTFKSSNEKIATVDEKGKVKTIDGGTATITVTSKADKTIKATCKVTVKVPITDLMIVSPKTEVAIGKKIALKVSISPANATNKSIKWKSNNTGVAKVDSNGTVTGIKVGKTTITAIATDGSGKKASINITVKDDSKTYPFNGRTYKIATTREKLESVLITIDKKNLCQSQSTYLKNKCGYVSCYHVKLLAGKVEEEYAKLSECGSCSYGTSYPEFKPAAYWKTIRNNIDKGIPMRVRVKNSFSKYNTDGNGYGQHFVTIVGYKDDCNGFDDLLMLGSSSGKLMVYNGSGAGEINGGRYGYYLRY